MPIAVGCATTSDAELSWSTALTFIRCDRKLCGAVSESRPHQLSGPPPPLPQPLRNSGPPGREKDLVPDFRVSQLPNYTCSDLPPAPGQLHEGAQQSSQQPVGHSMVRSLGKGCFQPPSFRLRDSMQPQSPKI